ncbi:nucleoside hydrolase [Micromonospora costi]|uniref:nucleoside hydrolase n=1 Tax=Micromonospora costi TaxID=1530042 RepID=UPI0033EFAF57
MLGARRLAHGVVAVVTAALAAAALGTPPAAASGHHGPQPVRLIFDTDFGGDVDDAGAAAMLNAMQDDGKVRVLAMMTSNLTRWAAPGLDAINTYYRHGNIPIGALRPGYDDPNNNNLSTYAEHLATSYPNNVRDSSRVPEAVDLYRKLLAKQPDHSVVIAVVGGQTNLAQLLASAPDRHSRLSGEQLVARKVHHVVAMGAQFPTGFEWNIRLDPAAAATVAERWPTPVIYSGFEVGDSIYTGRQLFFETPPSNPVRAAYELYVGFGNNRESWDITAVYYAVLGGRGMFQLSEPGTVTFAPDGSNTWTPTPGADRYYLRTTVADSEIASELEEWMIQPPERRGH